MSLPSLFFCLLYFEALVVSWRSCFCLVYMSFLLSFQQILLCFWRPGHGNRRDLSLRVYG